MSNSIIRLLAYVIYFLITVGISVIVSFFMPNAYWAMNSGIAIGLVGSMLSRRCVETFLLIFFPNRYW